MLQGWFFTAAIRPTGARQMRIAAVGIKLETPADEAEKRRQD